MTKVIFVEYSTLNHYIINLLRQLEEYNKIVVFSCDREQNRLAYEERLIDLEIGVDELLMRSDDDFTKAVDLRMSFVVDYFNGHDEKAIENTAAIICNHEPSIEMFREEGFFVVSTGWD